MYLFSVLLSFSMLFGNVPRKKEAKIANSMQSIDIYVSIVLIPPWDFNLNNVCFLVFFFFFLARPFRLAVNMTNGASQI